MNLISLRGNLEGSDSTIENKPYHVVDILIQGIFVWVDVWWHEDNFWLGTTDPKYKIKPSFLNHYGLWPNCKNLHTEIKMREMKYPRYFRYIGHPLLTNFGTLITTEYILEHEDKTALITDDVQLLKSGVQFIISDHILRFK